MTTWCAEADPATMLSTIRKPVNRPTAAQPRMIPAVAARPALFRLRISRRATCPKPIAGMAVSRA